MKQIIIHVDMDAFYASVEIRQNPSLKGKPLIIGSLPKERGVVATCSYEARKYGIHSAMNIKDAYRLCPNGIYMHPNFELYKSVSAQLHNIWEEYSSALEAIALDEAYLDVTEKAGNIENARNIAHTIKRRTLDELGLTCSVGVAYSKTAAKVASEEKKPNGYFEIPTQKDFVDLIIDRDVKVLYTVGKKTAEKLNKIDIYTVRDIQKKEKEVIKLLGKQGEWITQLASGIDNRKVSPYKPEDVKSISREITFQKDVTDYEFLKDVLFLLSMSVEKRAAKVGLYGQGVSLKITYSDMKSITRSKIVSIIRNSVEIYEQTISLLNKLPKKSVRLVGTGIYNLTGQQKKQLLLNNLFPDETTIQKEKSTVILENLHKKYGLKFAYNLNKIFHGETLYKTIEYMRKHVKKAIRRSK